jgi:excisionase family DNA binding protein
MSNVLNKNQLSEYLGVSIGKVDLIMKDGLRYYKFGRNVRFNIEDVSEYLSRNVVN